MIFVHYLRIIYFNPRPRKEGDLSVHGLCNSVTQFQSTPSQRGRRDSKHTEKVSGYISIHALAKRATRMPQSVDVRYLISIHALAKRATYGTKYSAVAICYFNPRPRKEGDANFPDMYDEHIISIHALAKRATLRCA